MVTANRHVTPGRPCSLVARALAPTSETFTNADAVQMVAVPKPSRWHADCRVLRRSLPTDTTLGRQAIGRILARLAAVMRSQPVIGLGYTRLMQGCGTATGRPFWQPQPSRRIARGRHRQPRDCVRGDRITAAQGQEQRSAVAERLGGRECELPLSRRSRGSGGGIGARIGRKVWDSSALSQVTGLAAFGSRLLKCSNLCL